MASFKIWLENSGILKSDFPYKANDIKHLTARGDLQNVAEWMDTPLDKLIFWYKLVPIGVFAKQAEDMLGTYNEFPQDRQRTNKISKKIVTQPLYPIFVEHNDSTNFVMEGRHRIVAFWQNGIQQVPVFYVQKENQTH